MNDESIPARVILGMLRGYKLLLSPLFAGSCRYLPSCSDYMAEAVHVHGAPAGLWLGLKRLVRCHPWGGSGLDPVPMGTGFGTRDSGFEQTKAGHGQSELNRVAVCGPGPSRCSGGKSRSGRRVEDAHDPNPEPASTKPRGSAFGEVGSRIPNPGLSRAS